VTVTSPGASTAILLNGEVLETPASDQRLTKGQIGFQCLHTDVGIEIRHVKLLRLGFV
jgi:hypothetical protein